MRFEIIRVERLRSRHLPQEPALIKERPLKRNAPPKRGISVEMGMRIQTEGCSALGHDGRWRWIFANRSLADRILANRSGRRRRRLPARQIGSGGNTQHRKGCGRRSQNLQHDVAPLVCTTAWSERSARSKWQNVGTETIRQRKGCAVICFPEICCIKSTSLNPDANVPAGIVV
jgi:hypothetical protein